MGLYETRDQLKHWIHRWEHEPGCADEVDWVEEHIEETFSVYQLHSDHRKRMKSTNMLERFNEKIRRRTRVVRIFPNRVACMRLVRAIAVEQHEKWVTGYVYLQGQIGLVKRRSTQGEENGDTKQSNSPRDVSPTGETSREHPLTFAEST